jgi:hypothetical protein
LAGDISSTFAVVVLLLWIHLGKRCPNTWLPPSAELWHEWGLYIKFTVPAALSIYLYCLNVELVCFVVGNLHNIDALSNFFVFWRFFYSRKKK